MRTIDFVPLHQAYRLQRCRFFEVLTRLRSMVTFGSTMSVQFAAFAQAL
jgi:hypothetical protein